MPTVGPSLRDGFAGFHGDVSAPSASVFNAVDESFNYLPSPPYPANHVQAAYVEPYVYVNGGKSRSCGAAGRLFKDGHGEHCGGRRVSLATPLLAGLRTFKGVATYARLKFPITPDSQWETLADMPTSRGAHGCGAIGTKIYCAYGRVLIRPWESTSVLESFDTETLQWSTDYPPGPGHPRDHVTVAVYEDKLYVFGGQYRKERTSRWSRTRLGVPQCCCFVEVPAAGAHPATRLWVGIAVAGGALQTVSDTVVFDPATKQWSVLADMPGFQASGAAALWRDTSRCELHRSSGATSHGAMLCGRPVANSAAGSRPPGP